MGGGKKFVGHCHSVMHEYSRDYTNFWGGIPETLHCNGTAMNLVFVLSSIFCSATSLIGDTYRTEAIVECPVSGGEKYTVLVF